jgi:class 3 adenylate cyclase
MPVAILRAQPARIAAEPWQNPVRPMLLNLWKSSDDPTALVPESARTPWQTGLTQARRAALGGRLDLAGQHLGTLLELLGDNAALIDLHLAVELELARLRSRHFAELVSVLHRFIQRLAGTPGAGLARKAIVAAAHSELELAQVRLRLSSQSFSKLEALPYEMAFNRLRAVGVLGLHHPAVGVLNLHLAAASHWLGDYDATLEYLAEANACFLGAGGERARRFTHERSDVLLEWAEVALDLGNLDQAETLLEEVLLMKDARRRKEPPSGIPLWSAEEFVTDTVGLAKCYGILGKLRQCQGRFDEALKSYEEDARLAAKPRHQVYLANRRGQVYLDMRAYDEATRVFEENGRSPDGAPLHRAYAYLGLARTELLQTMPAATTTDQSQGARQAQLRRQAQQRVEGYLESARQLVATLHGPKRGELEELLGTVQLLKRGHEVLDDWNVEEFKKVWKELRQKARACQARHELLAVSDILWDVLRMELWAWRVHRYVPPAGEGETYGLLLDYWERLGAHARLAQLQRWGEESAYGDAHRILLERYLPQLAGRREVHPNEKMTVLFADIREYSYHCQRLRQPERIVEMEADLFRAVNPVIQAHGGAILRYQGDSILVVFTAAEDTGTAGSHNHAERAVECALEVQRAVRRLNRLKRSYDPQAETVQLPIGIHTGRAAVAHLMIPGRREVTVVGNPVNLAKRVQEATRKYGLDLLVSGDTLSQVRAGVFREFLLAERSAFKGYKNEDVQLDVYAIRPAVPSRVSFVGPGARCGSQPGLLALDEGAAGLLDHPQRIQALLRKEAAEGPEALEIVLHLEPDFQTCVEAFLALEILEKRYKRGSRQPADMERLRVLHALADYAGRIARGDITFAEEDPAGCLYVVSCCIAPLLRKQFGERGPSQFDLGRRIVERGVQLIHLAVGQSLRTPEVGFDRIFQGRPPRDFEGEIRQAAVDRSGYEEHDKPQLHGQELAFLVPTRPGGKGRKRQLCGAVRDPRSALLEFWARRDNLDLLVVQSTREPLARAGRNGEGVVPLAHYTVRARPDSGLSLQPLAVALEARETARREEESARTGMRLARTGEPLDGFPSSDPWYDGRCCTVPHTVVTAPRQGSVLALDEVLDVMRRLYGSASERAPGPAASRTAAS